MVQIGEQIQVERSGVTRRVILEGVNYSHATVHWPSAGQYDIDLTDGEVKCRANAVSGVYDVDRDTGRVFGTRYRLSDEDMLRLDEIRWGEQLELRHDAQIKIIADVVDVLHSEGTLRLFVTTSFESKAVGRFYRTGWRVSAQTLLMLQKLRRVAC